MIPACEAGYTEAQVRELVEDFDDFMDWMRGQTYALCDGRRFNHDTREWEPACDVGHGSVFYVTDVERYLRKLPIVD